MPAPATPSTEQLMAEAEQKSAKYEWMAAADIYKQILQEPDAGRHPHRTAQTVEQLAKCHYRGAFQSNSRDQFKQRMEQARSFYEKSSSFYEAAGTEALWKKTRARALFAGFWINDEPAEKRRILDQCIGLSETAALLLEKQEDLDQLADVRNDLLTYFSERFSFAEDWGSSSELFEKVVRIGNRTVDQIKVSGHREILVESSCNALRIIAWESPYALEPPRFREFIKSEQLTQHVEKISKVATFPHITALANEALGIAQAVFKGDFASALNLLEAGLPAAELTRDLFLVSRLLTAAVISIFWTGTLQEDAERGRRMFERGFEYSQRALNSLEIAPHRSLLTYVYAYYAECNTHLAFYAETDAGKRRSLLEEAADIARRGMVYAKYERRREIHHALSKALTCLAYVSRANEDKARPLREALPIREDDVRTLNRIAPNSWDSGVMYHYLAFVKYELSYVEADLSVKARLLQDAASDMEQCIERCTKWEFNPSCMAALATYYERYGDGLRRLYELTLERDVAQRTTKAYAEAISRMEKLGTSLVAAGARWKLAKAYDNIGDYKEASLAFGKASEDYQNAAAKIPRVASTFKELSSYMQAWSLIEEARLFHDGEQYSSAKENYAKVETLLQTTISWSHMSKHYRACSLLEQGEFLSRQEQHDKSIQSFKSAADSFQAAEAEMKNTLEKTADSQEKQDIQDWLKITRSRAKYCLGRADLERAKLLDRKGEKEASLREYRTASEIFRTLLNEASSELDRREMETLTLFCDAWAKMKEAETSASPGLCVEAAALFMKVEQVTPSPKFRLLALANASMCRALDAGTRFRRTRDAQLYSGIKRELETSADYYQEAGYSNAASWTRATQRLFDALLYLADAEIEREAKRKAELYHLAEKHLQLAARLYDEAGFPSKKEEALKHLERAHEEKELLLTPISALSENPAATGTPVATASLTHDQALGSDKYETANIVGSLNIQQREISVGSPLAVELDIANVGRTVATLIKLEDIAPEGFELLPEKTTHRVEDHFINLKGKRLDYLKTDEVRVALKATRRGTYQLRPRLFFLDEKGNYKSCEFEPVPLTVKELGISGWLRGSK